MDQALIQVGLPVACTWDECNTTGYVKPKFVDPNYGGWYRSTVYRSPKRSNKYWYCPKHYKKGEKIDERFYEQSRTPQFHIETETVEQTQEELYKLLD